MNTEEITGIEDRIIEAAKLVFVRKGYEATKMGDIATEVGISRTSLHYYYRTKEILFEAIFSQLMDALLPNIGKIIDEEHNLLNRLPKIIDQYINILKANPLFPVFIIDELNRDPEHLFKTIMKNPERVAPIIRIHNETAKEMEKGNIKKLPFVDIITTLIGIIVFPMLIQYPIKNILIEHDKDSFDDFLERRKKIAYDVIYNMLAIDKTN